MDPTAYDKIILTDLVSPVNGEPVNQEDEEAARLLELELQSNVAALRSGGAVGPFYGFNGFADPNSPYNDFSQVTPHPISLVYWGSPHWSHEPDDMTLHFKTSSEVKTNAVESLAWLAKNAFILITFGCEYQVEFWQPRFKKSESDGFRSQRSLLVTEGFFRSYRPMASGVLLQRLHPDGSTIMVGMLVPERFRQCVKWRNGQCDVGGTMLTVIQTMGPAERAVEIGGQTFGLSHEIHVTNMEQMHQSDAVMQD